MSTNSANPDNAPDFDANEPIPDSGVNYDEYASDSDSSEKSNDTFSFHSSDINKQKKAEYFVNVEGAKRIKREQERREAEAKKKQIAELKRIDKKLKDKSDAEQKSANAVKEKMLRDDKKHAQKIARAEKKRRRKDAIKAAIKRIYRALFAGKKKFIWLGAVVLSAVIAGALYVYNGIIIPAQIAEREETTRRNAYTGTDAAEDVEAVMEKVSEMAFDNASNDEILSYVDGEAKKISSEGGRQMIRVLYWRIYGERKNSDEAISELEKIVSDTKLSYVKEEALGSIAFIYELNGDTSKAEEYRKKEQEYE